MVELELSHQLLEQVLKEQEEAAAEQELVRLAAQFQAAEVVAEILQMRLLLEQLIQAVAVVVQDLLVIMMVLVADQELLLLATQAQCRKPLAEL
jgi:hypothetical protein